MGGASRDYTSVRASGLCLKVLSAPPRSSDETPHLPCVRAAFGRCCIVARTISRCLPSSLKHLAYLLILLPPGAQQPRLTNQPAMDQEAELAEDASVPKAAFVHHHFVPQWNLEDVPEDRHEDGLPTKRPRQSYFCEVCDASFTEQRSLTRHRKSPGHIRRAGQTIESQLSLFRCTYCSKSFTRHEYRLRHEK